MVSFSTYIIYLVPFEYCYKRRSINPITAEDKLKGDSKRLQCSTYHTIVLVKVHWTELWPLYTDEELARKIRVRELAIEGQQSDWWPKQKPLWWQTPQLWWLRKLEVLIPLDADILELTPDDAIENERSKMRSTSAHWSIPRKHSTYSDQPEQGYQWHWPHPESGRTDNRNSPCDWSNEKDMRMSRRWTYLSYLCLASMVTQLHGQFRMSRLYI